MKRKAADKIKWKILDALEPKGELSKNKGRIIPTNSARSKKDRKRSGWKTFFADDEDYPVLIDCYDDWENYRDGQRYDPDKTHIRCTRACMRWNEEEIISNNKKLKIKEQIRRLRK